MVTIEEFIERLEYEFETIEPGILAQDSILRDVIDWNSVNALILIAMINTEYDVIINAEDLRNIKTVKDIYSIIVSRQSI
jgi:acyl carrier protein